MRELATAERIRRFMRALGAAAEGEAAVYFTGGATAVLVGWRESTIDVDVLLVPESDSLLRSLPRIKDDLSINVELASPLDFIPVPDGWEERSPSIGREGSLSFFHFDPYGQALAKAERAHHQDLEDVRALIESGLVDPTRALRFLEEIEPELYRFPAIDPPSFRARAEGLFRSRR
jgi:hypothetical protein